MQVEIDTKCMENKFGGCDLSGFRDSASRLPFCFPFKFPFQSMGHNMELAQKIHASKVEVEVEVNYIPSLIPLIALAKST